MISGIDGRDSGEVRFDEQDEAAPTDERGSTEPFSPTDWRIAILTAVDLGF